MTDVSETATSGNRLGDLWNYLVTNFITKVAQTDDFWGSCENHHFLSLTGETTFSAACRKTWATFYFHWVSKPAFKIFFLFCRMLLNNDYSNSTDIAAGVLNYEYRVLIRLNPRLCLMCWPTSARSLMIVELWLKS